MTLGPRFRRTAAQSWQRLPDGLRRTTIEVASRIGPGPVVGLPSPERVLVIAPHPDDETIGAGGTMALLAKGGATVEVVCVTDGEATIGAPLAPTDIADRRTAEVAAACAVLGANPPTLLHLPDGSVAAHHDRLVEELTTLVERHQPQLVLAPWVLDRHRDHVAVALAVADVASDAPAELWGYEAHVPLPPTRVVDVTEAIDRKRDALAAHVTAAAAFDLTATLGLARWRSLLTNAGHGFAEAFLACDWSDVPAMVEDLRHRLPGETSPGQ